LSKPPRSAVPLAASGIVCLGLVPTLGGPESSLHWATTAGMVAFGALLLTRHRLRAPEGPLERVAEPEARRTGRAVLVVCGIIAALMGVIVVARLRSGGSIGLLSTAMPLVGLGWLLHLGIKTRRHREVALPVDSAQLADRPSRRPPSWDATPNQRPSQTPPNRQVSA
jgi:hypothetical protein